MCKACFSLVSKVNVETQS